jgi:uncharacterized membrane protein
LEKQKLNATLIYVLSLLGFLCCCLAGLGIIPSGIAYYISNKQLKLAYADHENYENIDAMKNSKTVALVILIINAVFLGFVIFRINEIGGIGAFIDKFNEAYQEALKNSQQ